MKKIILLTAVLILSGVKYGNAQEVVNDLLTTVWSCHEEVNGEAFNGYKELTLSKNQFGVIYLKLVQKSHFVGDSVLFERSDIILEDSNDPAFTLYELYTADDLEFLVTIIPGSKKKSGHLTTIGNNVLDVDFVCKQ